MERENEQLPVRRIEADADGWRIKNDTPETLDSAGAERFGAWIACQVARITDIRLSSSSEPFWCQSSGAQGGQS